MLMDFLTGLNWIDILMAVVFARIVFIGIKTGFITEFFKFWGLLFSVFITLHYYSAIADFLPSILFLHVEPTARRICVFLFLWFIVTVIFKLVREGTMAVFDIKPHPFIDRWIGACLAVIRGMIACSMVFFVLLLSLNPGVVKLSEKSWSKYAVAHLATHIYLSVYWGVVVKMFPLEPINQEAMAIPKLVEPKKRF